MLMDGKFTPLKQDLAKMQITLNTVSRDEHVPEIKHCICTMKECVHFVYCSLPFKNHPKRMIVELIFAQNYWLNMFPHKDGVLQELSPQAIISGQEIQP